jgi:Inorganic pyrophosphatase
LPRGQHTPECRKGLVKMFRAPTKSASPSCRRRYIETPLPCGCADRSGGASRIDGNRQNTVLRRQAFDPLPHPPIRPRGGGFAKVFTSGWRFASLQSIQDLEADGAEPVPRQLLDSAIDEVVAGDARAACVCFPGGAEDGDPLDVMIIHEAATSPGLILRCQVIGALLTVQTEKGSKERNERAHSRPQLTHIPSAVSTTPVISRPKPERSLRSSSLRPMSS